MTGLGFRTLALGELEDDSDQLRLLMAEDETLFVEHKRGIADGEGFQLAKATASFANTLGGWILVGVVDRRPVDDWNPPSESFVDEVRVRLDRQLDPVPAFAARLVRLGDALIGVVRVYESADTPHILIKNGSVVVREPAQDRRNRYRASPIASHYELSQLMSRGQQARARAQTLMERDAAPWISQTMRLGSGTWATTERPGPLLSEGPAIVMRVAPLTLSERWPEVAVSKRTVDLATTAAKKLSGATSAAGAQPHARGLAVQATAPQMREWTPEANIRVTEQCTVAVDATGLIGIRLHFALEAHGGKVYFWRELADGQPAATLVQPIAHQLIKLLEATEALGRAALQIDWFRMADLFRVDPARGESSPGPPLHVPGSATITVDGLGDESELDQTVERFSQELARATGVAVFI